MSRRFSSALWGCILAVGMAAVISLAINPWFMDEPISYLAMVVLPFFEIVIRHLVDPMVVMVVVVVMSF